MNNYKEDLTATPELCCGSQQWNETNEADTVFTALSRWADQ